MKPILEPIHIGRQRTITGFRYAKANFETPWHFHPQHELTYIEESVGTKFIGDYVGPYGPGELTLLRSNLPHCWKNHVRQGQSSKSVVVQWNREIFAKVSELAPVFEMLQTASKGILFDKKGTAALIGPIRKLPGLKGHDLYIQLLTVLTELAKCEYRTLSDASFMDDMPSRFGTRMATVHSFVETNFNRKIYLAEVAGLVSMSEQSFSRFFSKMMGRPFFSFLNEYRINISLRMLLDTDRSVSQIGFACGYESLPFFYRQFKRLNGCSPLVYRKKHTPS